MELHCFCRRRDEGFMVLCDECIVWFHGKCVRITPEEATDVEFWYCIWCTQIKNNCQKMVETIEAKFLELKEQLLAEAPQQQSIDQNNQSEVGTLLTHCHSCDVQEKGMTELQKKNEDLKSNISLFQRNCNINEVRVSELNRVNEELTSKFALLKNNYDENRKRTIELVRENEDLKSKILIMQKNYTTPLLKKENQELKFQVSSLRKRSRLSLNKSD